MTSTGTFTGWVANLAQAHTVRLAGVAKAEGLQGDEALDAVQEAFETFLLLPQARDLVSHDEDARRLLSVIVRNAARNMRRRHHRAKPHAPVDEQDTLREDLPNAEQLLLQAEEHIILKGCIARLADVQRNVVVMRMLSEVSAVDMAGELGLTPNHIGVLLYRAKKELLSCMQDTHA